MKVNVYKKTSMYNGQIYTSTKYIKSTITETNPELHQLLSSPPATCNGSHEYNVTDKNGQPLDFGDTVTCQHPIDGKQCKGSVEELYNVDEQNKSYIIVVQWKMSPTEEDQARGVVELFRSVKINTNSVVKE